VKFKSIRQTLAQSTSSLKRVQKLG